MNIDLSYLYSRTKEKISIDGVYSLPKSYFENYQEVISIDNIKVDGYLYLEEDEVKAFCGIDGTIILKDSISLEPISYPISIQYDDFLEETLKNNENTLDIFQFLWENIVLEIPLQFTKVTDLSKFHGDGWKLIGEDDLVHEENPFHDLLKDFDKKE